MFKQSFRPGSFGLLKAAVVLLTICFVSYLALYHPFTRTNHPTPSPSPDPVEPTDPPTETPIPVVTKLLMPTFPPPTTTLEEINVVKWKITDICTFSVKTGVQITGAVISGGSPPYWVEVSYAYVENGNHHLMPVRSKATFSGTTTTYYIVSIDPPLNLSTGRWVNVTIKTSDPDKAIEWKDRLFFEQTKCDRKP